MNRKDIKDKLDIERAIEDMKTGLRMGCDVHLTISPVTQHFVVIALQEQLDRLEGCEYCNSNYKPISQYVGLYPKRAEIEINDAVDGDVQIDIKCCPNCGRKLRGEEND